MPDAFMFCISTPSTRLLHTGDFKFDLTPLAKRSDLTSLLKNGMLRPDVMLIDSTNADQPGFSKTEKNVLDTFHKIAQQYTDKAWIILIFSSNLMRIIQLVKLAKLYGRKVLVLGKSLNTNLTLAMKSSKKFLLDRHILINLHHAENYEMKKLMIICTGTQGEKNSAIYRIIENRYKFLKNLNNQSIVIFSGRVIPGNEKNFIQCVNYLEEKDITVIKAAGAHASGHGKQDDIRWMNNLVRPSNVIPVHGTFIKMKANAMLAQEFGLSKDKTFLARNGSVYELIDSQCKKIKDIECPDIFTDNKFDILSKNTLNIRRGIGNNGLVYITIVQNSELNFEIYNIECLGIATDKLRFSIKKLLMNYNFKLKEN